MTPMYSPGELARLLGVEPPTAEQAAVIGAPLAPAGVIAGAGSGKTSTMAARVVWLVANGLAPPEGVLGLTFTRKAATELSVRVRRRLDQLRSQHLLDGASGTALDGVPAVSTYHAYAGRLVAVHALREAAEPGTRLISPAVQWQLAASAVGAYAGPMDDIRNGPAWVIDAVLALAGELAEHLRQPAELRAELDRWCARVAARDGRRSALATKLLATAAATRQLLPLIEAYTAAKAGRGVLDYGDQVALAARIAARHPEVGCSERARYPVVLLDEYQDTGHAQRELLRALFGDGHPVTAVGDPCQSIYGWRGASAGGLRRFPKHFAVDGRPVPVQHLATSFRNAERILTVANRLAGPLRASDPEMPVLRPAAAGEGRGQVECALLASNLAEADWVADRIAATLAATLGATRGVTFGGDSTGDGRQPRDVAVLCRKRSQFALLRQALERRGIPVEVVGLGGLLTVPEVLDVISVLRILEDTTANDAMLRLLTSPRLRIGPRDLVALGARARHLARPAESEAADGDDRGRPADPVADALAATADSRLGSLVEALEDRGPPAAYSDVGYARLRALADEVRRLRERVDQPLPDLVSDVERTLGLDVEVAARPGADAISARADLDAFGDATAEFAGDDEEPTLRAFLAYLRAAEEEEFGLEMGRVGSGNSVKILTVHAAKGLEWPVVAVPGLAAGAASSLFPARPTANSKWTHNPRLLPFDLRGDAEDLPRLDGLGPPAAAAFAAACAEREQREERRLAYVAVTRAADVLLCSGFWWGEGSTRLGPSVFLTEIQDAVAEAGTIGQWCAEPASDAPNPLRAEPATGVWPAEPGGPAYQALLAGASQVEALRRAAGARPAGRAAGTDPTDPELSGEDGDLARQWAADAGLLLAERDAPWRPVAGGGEVLLPDRLSVTQLVGLARDPQRLAQTLRRPLPQRPSLSARRGTAFHSWLEAHYGQLKLLDLDELPGSGDDGAAADTELTALQAAFRRSRWWSRAPVEVEVPFDMSLRVVAVRGRIDAVFADADGGWTVIDWKTGRRPPASEADAVAVQLATYRLAWAALRGVALERVRAGFHYVPENVTVQPADLMDSAGLHRLLDAVPTRTAVGG